MSTAIPGSKEQGNSGDAGHQVPNALPEADKEASTTPIGLKVGEPALQEPKTPLIDPTIPTQILRSPHFEYQFCDGCVFRET